MGQMQSADLSDLHFQSILAQLSGVLHGRCVVHQQVQSRVLSRKVRGKLLDATDTRQIYQGEPDIRLGATAHCVKHMMVQRREDRNMASTHLERGADTGDQCTYPLAFL